MAEVPPLVRIKVSLKIQPNDGPVYFKVDGQRFGQNRTIKLLTGAKYKVEVALKPGTIQATTMGIGGVTVPLEETSREPQVVTYSGIYDTEGVTHTKSGERQPIQVNMQAGTSLLNSNYARTQAAVYGHYLSLLDETPELLILTGLESSLEGNFTIITILENFTVTDIGAFETVWQVKFYNYHKRDHCQWGNSFGCIEYECKPNETRSLMWINKETFF